MRLATLAAVALLSAPATVHAATTPVGTVASATSLSGFDGTYVTSSYDATDGKYQLSTFTDDDPTLKPLPVAATTNEIQANIGRDAGGDPIVIYSQCPTGNYPNCDLYTVKPGDTAPKKLGSKINTKQSETAPTIDGDTIAFARAPATKNGQDTVYAGKLTGTPKALKSAFPATDCSVRAEDKGSCKTDDHSIGELKLDGDHLAAVADYDVPDQIGEGSAAVRLISVKQDTATSIRSTTSGEGGQTDLGLSFAAGYLGWTRSCFGDPSGCSTNGNWRYNLKSHKLEHGSGKNNHSSGWVLTGATTNTEIDGKYLDGPGKDSCAATGCGINQVTDLAWVAAKK